MFIEARATRRSEAARELTEDFVDDPGDLLGTTFIWLSLMPCLMTAGTGTPGLQSQARPEVSTLQRWTVKPGKNQVLEVP